MNTTETGVQFQEPQRYHDPQPHANHSPLCVSKKLAFFGASLVPLSSLPFAETIPPSVGSSPIPRAQCCPSNSEKFISSLHLPKSCTAWPHMQYQAQVFSQCRYSRSVLCSVTDPYSTICLAFNPGVNLLSSFICCIYKINRFQRGMVIFFHVI